MTTVTVEPNRLAGAMRVRVLERSGPGEYRVASRSRPDHMHDVNLNVDPPCYCEDAQYSGHHCAHELKCRMVEAHETGNYDDPVLMSLGMMLLRRERAKES